MKILHVVASLAGDRGPPVVAAELAVAQAALGHEVAVLAVRPHDALDGLPGGEAVRVLEPVSGARLRALVAEHDLVHLHELWPPLILGAARAARRARTPYLLTPHGCLDPWALRQKALKKRVAMALAYRSVVVGAAALHAVGPREAAVLARWPGGPRVLEIPNGVRAPEALDADRAAATRPPALAPGRRFVLFLGRVHPGKGVELLVEAFARLAGAHPEVDLVIAGPDEGAAPELRRRVAAHGLAARVHELGPVAGDRKAWLLAEACCFALPSAHEGASMALLEGLAAGLPVVISPECQLDAVADAGAGAVVPREPAALASALDALLRDESARSAASARARAFARDHDWSATARRLLEAAVPGHGMRAGDG